MFRGAAKVSLDDKGRLVLPARYRERLLERSKGQLVVTVDRDGDCLLLYPLTDWEPVERKLMELPSLHPQARRLQRLMVGYATELNLDGHGRMLLPPELREFAHLERRAVLIGQGARCELWDEARWNERRDLWLKSEAAMSELPPELGSLSL
jgi:MraZ protein